MKRPTDRTTTAVVLSATGFIVFALASMTFNFPPALTASGAAFFTGLTLGFYIAWELRRAYLSDLIDYYMTAHDTRKETDRWN